ncbi:hypothetical protein [Microcoleus sp. Z1_C3]|uniref:hypothetical protein n=1 Tax=Microcoleus sp. Z1_C3 TaxID=3055431 RepID=UPI002FD3E040
MGLVGVQDWRWFDLGQLRLLLRLLCRWQWLLAVKENHQVCALMYPNERSSNSLVNYFLLKFKTPSGGINAIERSGDLRRAIAYLT